MARSSRDYDESDVRIRPSRRGSRPRSKDRPAHEDAVPGQVTTVDRGRYTTLVGEGPDRHVVLAMRARLPSAPVVSPGCSSMSRVVSCGA
jgi:ribosome biogenesis GTPase / thiamine phosphate phosphatase